NLFGIEAMERLAEVLAFSEDRDPRKPGLKPVQHEFLVKRPVVIFGNAPFLIVICDVERVGPGPRAPLDVCHLRRAFFFFFAAFLASFLAFFAGRFAALALALRAGLAAFAIGTE